MAVEQTKSHLVDHSFMLQLIELCLKPIELKTPDTL